MSSVNKVMLLGRLGRDPEMRYSANGDARASFSVATNFGKGDAQTEWVRCTAWRKAAEAICEHARKGDQVYVQGRSQTRKWTDEKGVEKHTTEIAVSDFQVIGKQVGPFD